MILFQYRVYYTMFHKLKLQNKLNNKFTFGKKKPKIYNQTSIVITQFQCNEKVKKNIR